MYGGRYGHWMNPALMGGDGLTGYPLTDYPNGLLAYSFRKVKQTATLTIRIIEDGGLTETDIGFDGDVMDEAAIVAHCGANNGFIVTHKDQSGNGYDSSQAVVSQQSQIYDGANVLKKNLKFAALNVELSNQFYQRAALAELAAGNAFSSFSVTSEENNPSVSGIWCNSTLSGNRVAVFHDTRLSPIRNLIVIASGTTYAADLSAARPDQQQHLLSSFVDTSKNMSAFDNGAAGGTDTYVGTYANDTFDFLRQAAGSVELDGYFQELLLFSADMSADRVAIETNINNYYSIF